MQPGGTSGRVVGGRWELGPELGAGGMGRVYAARGPDGRPCAVKLLHAELCSDPEMVQRFFREAAATERIQHPSVAQIVDRGVDANREVYLVMELLEGESLSALAKHALPKEQILYIAQQVLEVLVIAHGQGIVHRDIKPSNLFLTRDGRLVVLDFGIARMRDELSSELRTRTGVAMGSLPYMPPEQAAGRQSEIDGRSDLFALGATLFELIAQRRIRAGRRDLQLVIAAVEEAPPPLASVVPGVDPGLAAVVDRALAYPRNDRYPNARDMLEDIVALRAGRTPIHARQRVAQIAAAGASAPTLVSGSLPTVASGPVLPAPPPSLPSPSLPSPSLPSPSLPSPRPSRLPYALIGGGAGVAMLLLVCGLGVRACYAANEAVYTLAPSEPGEPVSAKELIDDHRRGVHPRAGKHVRVTGQVVELDRQFIAGLVYVGVPGVKSPTIECLLVSSDLDGVSVGGPIVVDGRSRSDRAQAPQLPSRAPALTSPAREPCCPRYAVLCREREPAGRD